jgi:hypothetical protein
MMPEILTESFCERCGTRYTFESAAPRKTKRLGQFKTLSKGMKNWVMSDDTSLDEAMAAARSDEEREMTSQQLDAFHSTFNFCMNCRQYTCANCWNGAEGRCLTCAPHLGQEVLGTPFPETATFDAARIEAEAWPEIDLGALGGDGNGNGNGGHAVDGWGEATDPGIAEIDPAARLAFLSGDAPAPVRPAEPEWPTAAAPEPPTDSAFETALAERSGAPAEPAMDVAAPEGPDGISDVAAPLIGPDTAVHGSSSTEPLPPTVEGRAAAGAGRTSDLLRKFRPGQSLDAELAAYEAELDRQEAEAAEVTSASEPAVAEAAPEPVGAEAAVAPDPVELAPSLEPAGAVADVAAESESLAASQMEPAPEPIAATAAPEPEPAPEPIAATATPEPAPEPAPSPAAAEPAPAPEPAREDRIQQPTWRIYAPDATAPGLPAAAEPGTPAAPGNGSPTPQWPVDPARVESPAMALLMNRGNAGSNAGLWAASSREVLAQPGAERPGIAPSGVQPCSNCGLSLSATARFCRRCGTRQG